MDDDINIVKMEPEKDDIYIRRMSGYIPRNICVSVTLLLSFTSLALLVVMIMSMNGTIQPLRDWNYVRPAHIDDMNSYAVVSQTMVQCRDDLPMRFHTIKIMPDPLVMPDTDRSNVDLQYNITLLADLPKDMSLSAMIQRLEPPWQKLECVDMSGSCHYPDACTALGKIFGRASCLELKAGHHQGTVSNLLIDRTKEFKWTRPGNYYAQIVIKYLDQVFGCVGLTFRIVDRDPTVMP